MFFYGRRWSYKVGGWESFQEFKERQDLMDKVAYGWLALIILGYLGARYGWL